MSLPRDVQVLAAIFAVSGTAHLVKPELYEPIVPSALPAHRELVVGSGVAELALAAGLLHPRTRAAAGWGSFGLLLAVWPANAKMAKDAQASRSTALKVGTVARLPLQLPMLRSALKAARGQA